MPTVLEVARAHSLMPEAELKRLFLLAKSSGDRVDGDFVECGVYRGGSAMVIGQALTRPGQRLWLFDSFAGMPATTDADGDYAALLVGEGAVDPSEVTSLLEASGLIEGQIEIRQGPFERTFQESLPTRISFLHIDVCWYQSVLMCLQIFYDRVAPGGVVLLDDFGFWEGCRRAFYSFIRERGIEPLLNDMEHHRLIGSKIATIIERDITSQSGHVH